MTENKAINHESVELKPDKPDEIRPSFQIERSTDTYERFERLNKIAELLRLERRSAVTSLLRESDNRFTEMDTTLARRISGVILRNDDADSAYEQYKRIRADTESQRRALSLDKDDFSEQYLKARSYLTEHETEIVESIYNRTHYEESGGKYKKGQILWNDYYETNQNSRRSLELLRLSGVTIDIPAEYIDLLRTQECKIDNEGACPVLEKVKNEKIFTISGLKGSKASLTIHDLFDHYWTYNLLEEKGIFSQYSDFLDKVGNPQNTDMFKRESELIASTVFGTRLFRVSETDFKPIFSFNEVKTALSKGLKNSNNDSAQNQNIQRALSILNNLEDQSYEARSITYVISNMAIEIMEQRRKHGPIKTLEMDSNGELMATGILKILDPEYLALMVEVHHLILDPENRSNEVLVNISAIVEEYLWEISQQEEGVKNEPLIVKLDDINLYKVENSRLPTKRIDWLKGNSGFASTKSSLC